MMMVMMMMMMMLMMMMMIDDDDEYEWCEKILHFLQISPRFMSTPFHSCQQKNT